MQATFRKCVTSEDYAQFTLFFIRNRNVFNEEFTLDVTLLYLLESLTVSHVILIRDPANTVIGWGHYRHVNQDNQYDPAGEIAFVDSVFLSKEYRSSRTFLQGLCHMVNQIKEENNHVNLFRFRAHEHNVYLNRLYAKFAHVIGKIEGYSGEENMYSTDFQQLQQYLKRMSNRGRAEAK